MKEEGRAEQQGEGGRKGHSGYIEVVELSLLITHSLGVAITPSTSGGRGLLVADTERGMAPPKKEGEKVTTYWEKMLHPLCCENEEGTKK